MRKAGFAKLNRLWKHCNALPSPELEHASASCSLCRNLVARPTLQSSAGKRYDASISSAERSSQQAQRPVADTASSSSSTTSVNRVLEGPPGSENTRGGAGASNLNWPLLGLGGAVAAGVAAALGTIANKETARESAVETEEGGHFTNWSGTHEVRPKRLYQPESVEELESIVADAHEKGERLRCVGSALSPNGIAFSEEGMVSLALLDKVLHVDKDSGRVTVQAGARVQEVVEALRPHGLTLQNFASIREQSIGGYTQVSAHGTGASIPTVDEQIVSMKLVTPGKGTLELSETSNPELFSLAKVGLGLLGVVSEVTLQCYPAHNLLEETFVATAKEVQRHHKKWLRENRHIKYLWIPYTNAVVVVKNNPVPEGTQVPRGPGDRLSEAEKACPFRDLLLEQLGDRAPADVQDLSGPQLRDKLLEIAPLDVGWVKRVNQAEAEFWKRNAGFRLGTSDQLLGFDCGGQQWVLESCFPTGTLRRPNGADLQFMHDMVRIMEDNGIPAPAPIEQRWSASSRAAMSPASPPDGNLDTVHSWVGIIMYLPQDDEAARAKITDSFTVYSQIVERDLLPKYNATPHWAKLEVNRMGAETARQRLAERFPVKKFNAARAEMDPKNILSNCMLDAALPREDL